MKSFTATIKSDRRLVRLSFLYGLLFSAAIVTGRRLEQTGYLAAPRPLDVVLFLCIAVTAAGACAYLLILIDRRSGRSGSAAASSRPAAFSVRGFLGTWAGLAAAHMIVLLAEYPGFFCYDATDELYEFDMRSFTTHHPLLHELVLGTAVRGGETLFGDVNAGIFLHILLQMLLITGTLSLLLQAMRKYGVPRPVRILLFLYYAFFPPVVMFSLCSSKDTPFCAFMLLALLLLARFDPAQGFGRGRRAMLMSLLFILAAAFSMLFRHNAFYSWAVCIPVLLLFYPRTQAEQAASGKTAVSGKYRLILSIAAALILCTVITFALTSLLHARKEGPGEMLTVPIQQLARLWNDDRSAFSEQELETLYRYIPEDYLRHYRPVLSDPVKAGFSNAAAKEDLAPFIRLWAAKGMQHPFTYVNGWLNTCYGFWYPGAVINVYAGNTVHTFTYQDSSYFGYEVEYPGERHSLIPAIDSFYRRLSIERFQQEIPVVSLFFAPAAYLWIWTLVLFYLLWKKDRQVFTLLPVFLYILTLLLGPTYLVRYVILLFFGLGLLPVLTAAGRPDAMPS